jgi:phosphoglycolate phosphatase
LAIKGLIFDFDGTLAHLNIDFLAMSDDVQELARSMGYAQAWPDQGYLLEQVDEVAAEIGDGFYERAHQLMQEREINAAKEGGLFPFTMRLLAEAAEAGYLLGVVSRNCRVAIETAFPSIGQYCGVFLPREEAPQPKPHPGQVLAACERLELEPAMTAMVGDHPTDMMAGQAAGCLCIGVTSGRQDGDSLKEAGAQVILPDASELLTALASR